MHNDDRNDQSLEACRLTTGECRECEEAGGDEESSETTDDGSPRDPVQ